MVGSYDAHDVNQELRDLGEEAEPGEEEDLVVGQLSTPSDVKLVADKVLKEDILKQIWLATTPAACYLPSQLISKDNSKNFCQ